MKHVGKIVLPLAVGALCTWLVFRNTDWHAVFGAWRQVTLLTVILYLSVQAVTHLFRALRWEYLLRPLGLRIATPTLLGVSSVGFMTILAFPFRMGEFVRPYLVRRHSGVSMAAVLGTVAVERIIDGVVVGLILFGAYLSSGASYSGNLRLAVWLSLFGFSTALGFLALALARTDATIALVRRLTLLHWLSPARAEQVSQRLHLLVQGFHVLRQPANLVPFLIQTLLYWAANALGMWLLADRMGLSLSFEAALAAMSVTGVMLAVPNPPANIGLFQGGILLALGSYVPASSTQLVIAYGWMLWALQAVWYVAMGLVGMRFVGSGSLRQMVAASQQAASQGGAVS